MPDLDLPEYSPEQIRWWLSGRCPRCRWAMLESAAESPYASYGNGGGRGERMGLVHLLADLERAADALPPYWQSTRYILAKQHRPQRTVVAPSANADYESPVPSQALDDAIWRMARTLGWSPVVSEAA